MDWKRCIICQKLTRESLQCPANSKRKDPGAGYISFIRNAKEFTNLGITVTSHLDVLSQGIEQILIDNKASWHKSCKDYFNTTKLERAKKRKLTEIKQEERNVNITNEESNPSSPVKARRSSSFRYDPSSHCFFCEESSNPLDLHCASTLEVDQKVRECATLLNDSKLIGLYNRGINITCILYNL